MQREWRRNEDPLQWINRDKWLSEGEWIHEWIRKEYFSFTVKEGEGERSVKEWRESFGEEKEKEGIFYLSL